MRENPSMIPNDVTRDPDLKGAYGNAWKFDIADIDKRANAKPHGSVEIWLIHAAWAHPVWHSYALSLVHLRPIEGLGPPLIHLHGATHEIVLYALAPDQSNEQRLRCGRLQVLTPANFAAQLIEPDDESAKLKVKAAVEAVVAGRLSPDTDYVTAWAEMFNYSMMRGQRQ